MSSCVGAISLDSSAFYFSLMLTRRIISFLYLGFADSSEACCVSIGYCPPTWLPRIYSVPHKADSVMPEVEKNVWINVNVLLMIFKARLWQCKREQYWNLNTGTSLNINFHMEKMVCVCVCVSQFLVCLPGLDVAVAFRATKALDQEPLIRTVLSGLSSWKYRPLSCCRLLKQTLNKLFYCYSWLRQNEVYRRPSMNLHRL